MPDVLTVKMLAARWGCSMSFVYSEIEAGHLTAMRFGPKLLQIQRSAVETYEAGATVGTPPAPAPAMPMPTPIDVRSSARLLRTMRG